MTRRFFLALLTRLLGLATAVAVAVPGLRLLADPLRKRGGATQRFRIAKLDDLPVGTPVRLAIRGKKVDAWKVHPEQVLGYVWVLRPSEGEADKGLLVFSATCPHLGCVVDFRSEKHRFYCPCHGAVFEPDGTPVPSSELRYANPAPRSLDPLPYELVRDEDGTAWVEVEYVRFELNTPERRAV